MNRLEKFRLRRRRIYDDIFSAPALCFTGLIIMPALLFNPISSQRIIQFLFFWFLAWLSGKKTNPLITIMIVMGIVAFNLIIPYGRLLFSIGVFRITSGALRAGIHRAVTLEGLIMLSFITIRKDLKIPGLFGELIGESFRIFAIILDSKPAVTWKNFFADIDRLMLELSGDDAAQQAAAQPAAAAQQAAARTKPVGFVILAVAAILSWLPWVML